MLKEILEIIVSDKDYAFKLTDAHIDWLNNNKQLVIDPYYDYSSLRRIQGPRPQNRTNVANYLSCTKYFEDKDIEFLMRRGISPIPAALCLIISDESNNEHVLIDIDFLYRSQDISNLISDKNLIDKIRSEKEVIVLRSMINMDKIRDL